MVLLIASSVANIQHWNPCTLSEFDSLIHGSPWMALCDLILFHVVLNRFEKQYDPIYVLNWMREHPMVPVFACVVYGVLIVWGQHVMAKREPWNWRRTMALWNLSLSLFSWFGMFRTAPQLVHNLYHMSVRDNLCLDPRATYGSGSTGLWVQLFILSKFP